VIQHYLNQIVIYAVCGNNVPKQKSIHNGLLRTRTSIQRSNPDVLELNLCSFGNEQTGDDFNFYVLLDYTLK
jgi:hypothetical protein